MGLLCLKHEVIPFIAVSYRILRQRDIIFRIAIAVSYLALMITMATNSVRMN